MNITLEQDCTNSYRLTIDGLNFTITTESGEEFTEEEIGALVEMLRQAKGEG